MAAKEARGIGLGLRQEIAAEMLARRPDEIEWVEIHPENYVERAGSFERHLADARAIWPVVPHGLSLCFGSIEPFEPAYLRKLRAFLDAIDAPWYSDHLCWGGVDGVALHDLMPMPFVRESVDVACARIAQVEDAIGRPVAIENVSYYVHPGAPEMHEIDFVLEVLERSGCRMMLDVNNVYVNARNHGFDARTYLDRIPADRVVQIHVAGHLVRAGQPIIDTHAEPICDDVYALIGHTLARMPDVPVLLERDGNFPALDVLLEELRRLRAIADGARA
ncbi:DUF692 domain-containing protein [Sandaracinus amylolyticus]|uniref:DUF692 domain-containing protein n=1 Tax=Sandaracinus amylolyticus TaxID=927083 RepID=UPI001F332672|nr:DUF692 domain-containing protein [Sandaracinus amylolyticus]UJR86179.1 Hypothetical protein I5071_82610 [Sandaracinus amylolyticus]